MGNAVVRNRVERQLRHLMRERIADLAPGQNLVIRVFRQARGKNTEELGQYLDTALRQARRN